MTYKQTPIKSTSKDKETMHDLKRIGTPTIVWFLVRRHKSAIIITWAVVMTINWAIPAWPSMIASIWK